MTVSFIIAFEEFNAYLKKLIDVLDRLKCERTPTVIRKLNCILLVGFYTYTKNITDTYLLTYLLIYGTEPFLRSCQLCSPSGTSQLFMEPEGSIPCSQEPSTGQYPEPYQSNPLHPILSL
jgi:hypothetical protein